MPIDVIETEFAAPPIVDGADPTHPSTWWPAITLHTLRQTQPWRVMPTIPKAYSLAEPLEAYVNHGRWVVDCSGCTSAQLCTPADPQFWCPSCGSGGVWHKIRFPKNRHAIEGALERRAFPAQRNWTSRETIADLQRENHLHGVD